jgi:hypothetical protein
VAIGEWLVIAGQILEGLVVLINQGQDDNSDQEGDTNE